MFRISFSDDHLPIAWFTGFLKRARSILSGFCMNWRSSTLRAFGIALACIAAAPALADSADLVVITRAGERIVVVIAGVIALALGYKLFDKAADLGALTAEVPQKIKLQMQRIGPGIFFALFGTAILIYVMSSNIDVSRPSMGA